MQLSVATMLGAMAALVHGQAVITNSAFDISAGQPFTLTWSNATGPVTVELDVGPSGNLKPFGSPLATGVTTNSFTWTPPSSLPNQEYAFRVIDGTGVPNFSKQFSVSGASGSATVASTGASSTTAASSTSAVSTTSMTSMTSMTSTTTMMTTNMSSSSSSMAMNSTTTSTTTKTTSTASSTAHTSSSTPINTNDGQRFASPLALVLVTVAAMIFSN